MSSPGTKVARARTLPSLVSCSARKRLPKRPELRLLQSLPRASPVPSDGRQEKQRQQRLSADGNLTNQLHLLGGLVQSREGAVHTGAGSLSAHGHERKIMFSEIKSHLGKKTSRWNRDDLVQISILHSAQANNRGPSVKSHPH